MTDLRIILQVEITSLEAYQTIRNALIRQERHVRSRLRCEIDAQKLRGLRIELDTLKLLLRQFDDHWDKTLKEKVSG